MAYMLSSWLKVYVFVTKAAIVAHVNFQARAMVEKWKSLFWAVQTVIVSSAESQQRYACVNKTLN